MILGPKLAAWGSKIWMPVGKRVVVMGGDRHGCEVAEFMAKRGRQVTLLHTGEEFGEGMTVDDKLRLFPWFDRKGVARYGGIEYKEIADNGIIITAKGGEETVIEADTVISDLLQKPNLNMETALKGKVPEVYSVGSGDKPEPDLMVDAIAAGANIAHQI
jgi:thioredoxin reductase